MQTNAAIDPTTLVINNGSFGLYDTTISQYAAGTYSQSADGLKAYLAPSALLATGRLYRIYFGCGNLTDLVGNGVSCTYYSSFTSGFATSTTAPQVTAVSPGNGVTQVPINGRVTIQFNEPVNPQTIGQVTLKAGGTPVSILASLGNGNQTLTLIPAVALFGNTVYTVSIAGVARYERQRDERSRDDDVHDGGWGRLHATGGDIDRSGQRQHGGADQPGDPCAVQQTGGGHECQRRAVPGECWAEYHPARNVGGISERVERELHAGGAAAGGNAVRRVSDGDHGSLTGAGGQHRDLQHVHHGDGDADDGADGGGGDSAERGHGGAGERGDPGAGERAGERGERGEQCADADGGRHRGGGDGER